ncbi:PQQ-dependent sugar dehydrogenase [Flavobacterium terrigena]|uniref:Por secretion system C-terminal sorting domain-containing protein n=1 Tax=Flavobacterium terrigena TaxID=402734 RepID=A0A1H6T0C8_9FLAO|nr:PQQ-dependent sugar dehydrogenase [Flavobacterium terrigena]SEI69695.1 Por secretion system C-terminal sorting domain-containing protein [Flavobacterium terrigena]
MKTTTSIILLCIFNFAWSQSLNLQSFGTGFTSPVEIAHAGDSRLFVVEQTGRIKILNTNGSVNATPFLNISTIISSGGERGLLGLAFHPNYTSNGYFFVNYTNTAGNTVIARYSVSGNPDIADTTGQILMTITQPYSNHNGGCIKFGPDGFLYIAMGDGGSAGDPENRAQNINENLGKMLRIDVNSTVAPFYINPPTNPYVGIAGNDEIWAIGLRNPWKFSFDKSTGDLWIADVGQGVWEEVNKVSPTLANVNYGWKCFEGNAVYNSTGNCASITGTTAPLAVANHNTGACSITGGYVYRGTTYPNLVGKYLFSDYCLGKIGITTSTGATTFSTTFSGNFVSFGEDVTGELYISDIGSGTIYKIVDTSLSNESFEKNLFTLYPNPAKNILFIDKSQSNYPTEIQIYDVNGKLVLQQETGKISQNKIDISPLTKGFYFVTIKNDNDENSQYKLVVE